MSITAGSDQENKIPRRSIATQERIPNAAIFLRRTTIEFLQIIFSTRKKGAGQFCWSPDDSETEIQISDLHAVNLVNFDQRPKIVGVRGPVSWQGLGLGGGSMEMREMTTGNYAFNDLLTGSVAFNCISREGIEAEQIAHLVFNSFKFFRPDLQKSGFFTIKSLNIGAESLIEQAGPEDKTTLVPVFVTAMIQDRWSLVDAVGRKLRKIVITQMTEGG